MSAIDRARELLLESRARRVFPGAVTEVGSSAGTLWRDAVGTLTFDTDALPALETTPYDLASLTKVIATTTLVMDLVATGDLQLEERVGASFPEWQGADREMVTVQDLLEHSAGLPARLFDSPPASRREFEHEISVMRLEYPPRTRSIYSDLGFILLGFLVERRGRSALAAQFADLVARLGSAEPALLDETLAFGLPAALKAHAAPTRPEQDEVRRGRLLAGEVHDCYAAALGGAAGHAGLFGTAAGVAAFARAMLRAARGEALPAPLSPSRVARFLRKTTVAGSSRALGWDTMLPTSSCGGLMSPEAVGHVGFTGTSLWIDPARDRYFVLLTNRACGGGTLDEMRAVRRAFHDTLHEL